MGTDFSLYMEQSWGTLHTFWADTQVCPYLKRWINICIQEMSLGAIGVTNPSYIPAGLATCPPL
jgi:hypothetical protein